MKSTSITINLKIVRRLRGGIIIATKITEDHFDKFYEIPVIYVKFAA